MILVALDVRGRTEERTVGAETPPAATPSTKARSTATPIEFKDTPLEVVQGKRLLWRSRTRDHVLGTTAPPSQRRPLRQMKSSAVASDPVSTIRRRRTAYASGPHPCPRPAVPTKAEVLVPNRHSLAWSKHATRPTLLPLSVAARPSCVLLLRL